MKQSEILNTQTSVEQTDNKNSGSEEITRDHIEGTPFTAIKKDDTGYFAVMGHYRLTEEYETKAELEEFVNKRNNWELMMNVVSIMVEELNKNK